MQVRIMRIPLNRSSVVPLYCQIRDFLGEQIRSNALPAGTRLPATRELANDLGVSRLTITNAYAELQTESLINIRPGSGAFVAPPSEFAAQNPFTPSACDCPLWQQALPRLSCWLSIQREVDHQVESVTHPDPISFSSGLGDSGLFPIEDFRRALQAVLRRMGIEALDYGHQAGYLPLRAIIAHILASQGVPAHPERVLITSGAQQAISLVASLLLRPGDLVLVESPTYGSAIKLFRTLGLRLLGVPVDDQGMQVDQVEEALKKFHPKLIYTIPTFHNPTGTCLSEARRRKLVALANRYNVPILEDDFVGDLRYSGQAQPALKALDSCGRVIYVGTFSKILAPGLRLGFLVASSPVYEQLVASKRLTDLASPGLLQRALAAYITVGRYQGYLQRICRVYRQRRDAMLAALKKNLPSGAHWFPPQGGLFIWLKLPPGLSTAELYPLAVEEGVIFASGFPYFPGEREESHLRLNFAVQPPERIEEGVKRLGRALERLLASQGAEAAEALRGGVRSPASSKEVDTSAISGGVGIHAGQGQARRIPSGN